MSAYKEENSELITKVRSTQDVEFLRSLVENLLNKQQAMLKDKGDTEVEFGRKRAMFKDLFMKKEEELQNFQMELEKLKKDKSTLEVTFKSLQKEFEESQSLLAVACQKESELISEKEKYEGEIASLEHIIQESVREAVERTTAHYEKEIKKLETEIEMLEAILLEYKNINTPVNEFKQYSNHQTMENMLTENKRSSYCQNLCIKPSSLQQAEVELEISHLKEELKKVSEQCDKEKELTASLRMTMQQNTDASQKIQNLYVEEIQMLQSVLNQKQLQQLYNKNIKSPNGTYYKEKKVSNRSSQSKHLKKRNRSYSPLLGRNEVGICDISKNSSIPNNLNEVGIDKEKRKIFGSADNIPFIYPDGHEINNSQISLNTPLLTVPRIYVRPDQLSEDFVESEAKEVDLKLLKNELDQLRQKAKQPCEMCMNYELQLQQKQKLEQQQVKEIANLQLNVEQYKQDLCREQTFRNEMEEKFDKSAQNYMKETFEHLKKVESSEKNLHQLKRDFTAYKNCIENELKSLRYIHHKEKRCEMLNHFKYLKANVEKLNKEMEKLIKENDNLLGKYIVQAQRLQSETIDLPNNLEEIQFCCLKFREELITSLVNKEIIENNLRSELLFLHDQMKAEQFSKESLINELTQEIHQLKKQLANSEHVNEKYEESNTKHFENEYKLITLQKQLKVTQQKVCDQETKLKECAILKEKLESEVHLQKSNIQNLQAELENSESVQKDFVKLSQSLQMELESIRQSNNEIRWQHEDDVDSCRTCKNAFNSSKEKIHCSHCGKIFCAECCSKIVCGGPRNRPFKVCAICHTILNPESAPYFSNKPPSFYDH